MARLLGRKRRSSAVLAGEAAAAAGAAAHAAQLAEDPDSAPGTGAAGFFDLDNTLMRGASVFYLARGLAARKFFDNRDIAKWAWQQACFRIGGAENANHMADAREAALSFVKGHQVEELTRIGEEIFDEYMAAKIWPGTRAQAQAHLDADEQVWLVTAAPVELAGTIARRLGLTGALGTVAESVGGVYTGRLVGEPLHGPAKAEAVRALVQREGLDLSRCAAYSDSSNDIPMLSLVGHAFAVNPDAVLRRHAKANGWQIRDYRTGRKAIRIGFPTAAGAAALVGGVAAGVALRRRYGR